MSGYALIVLHKIANDRFDSEEGEPERTQEANINVFSIRNFYPRKDGRPGTRITFNDGGGYAVAEPVEYVGKATTLVAKGKPQPPAPAPQPFGWVVGPKSDA
jgi:hypothetical protein